MVPGRRRASFDSARQLRKSETTSEAMLWERIRGRKLYGRKFRRQHPAAGFVVDFYCAEEGLAVEIDGGIHAHQRGHDAARQEIIESSGVRFVRLDDAFVRHDVDAALDQIVNAFRDGDSP